MARFSLTFLALCFFLALVVSALPAKRASDDLDAGEAVRTAFDALQAIDTAKEKINSKQKHAQDAVSSAQAAHTEDRVAAPEPAPSPSPTTAEKPAPAPAASKSAAAAAASAHASDNFLSKVPIFGPLLGGGEGLGSIL